MKESAIVIKSEIISHDRLIALIKKEDKTFDPPEPGTWQIQVWRYSNEIKVIHLVSHSLEKVNVMTATTRRSLKRTAFDAEPSTTLPSSTFPCRLSLQL